MEQGTASRKPTDTPASPSPSTASPSETISQNLRAGARNDDVKVLQRYLIGRATGTYARTLSTYGATGYYGVLTTAAVAEFQKSAGIAPAAGYCGPRTRAYIAAHA